MSIELQSAGDKPYKVYGGTWYHASADDDVIRTLESCRIHGSRTRIYYGDRTTGRSWLDEWNMIGTIGRSCGQIKIPLIVANARSSGGPGLLEHCIVAIQDVKTKHWMYRHPAFYVPKMRVAETDEPLRAKGYTHGVFVAPAGRFSTVPENFSNQANFKSAAQAQRYVQFMHGERMAK